MNFEGEQVLMERYERYSPGVLPRQRSYRSIAIWGVIRIRVPARMSQPTTGSRVELLSPFEDSFSWLNNYLQLQWKFRLIEHD